MVLASTNIWYYTVPRDFNSATNCFTLLIDVANNNHGMHSILDLIRI